MDSANGNHFMWNGSSDTRRPAPANMDATDGVGASMNGETPAVMNGAVKSTRHVEMLRLVGQFLRDSGYNKTFEMLMEETRIEMEHSAVSRFRNFILNGEWEEAERGLEAMGSLVRDATALTDIRFALYEQQYLECLETGQVMEALACLRNKMTPMKYRLDRIRDLTSYIMFGDLDELRNRSGWRGRAGGTRQALVDSVQSHFPASTMLPPRRLHTIVEEAVQWQMSRCRYHNSTIRQDQCSLLADHECTKDEFPSHCNQIVHDHADEVWVCRFSPDGNYLATGSKDGQIMLWKVNRDSHTVSLSSTTDGFTGGVSCVAWSRGSPARVAILANEEPLGLWVYEAPQTSFVSRIQGQHVPHDEVFSAVDFCREGSKRLVAGSVRGRLYEVEEDTGSAVNHIEGVRVQSLKCFQGPSDQPGEAGRLVDWTLVADSHNRLRKFRFDLPNHPGVTIGKEQSSIMTLRLTSDSRYALCSVTAHSLHLWDLEGCAVVMKFTGVVHGNFTIHSCIGGLNEDFVASGSEDNRLTIWNRRGQEPLLHLDGHMAALNCVDWNPTLPSMLASVSDDKSLRIWSPVSLPRSQS